MTIQKKMTGYIEKLFSLPKSFYVSYRLTSFRGCWCLPVFCRFNVKCISLRGRLCCPNGGGRMYVGFNDVGIFDKKYSRTILEVDGEVNVCGRCFIGHGSRLCIAKHAKLTIGDGFVNTAEGTIVCTKSIFIGKNVTTSWNSLIMDTDFHPVLNTLTGMQGSICKDVVIENGSWICTRAVVLKGSKIGKRCIVGAGAVVKGYFLEPECLIEGNPAIITRHHVTKGIEDHE